MHADELWQVFSENGQHIAGRGEISEAFDKDQALVMGNAHVWFWKKGDTGTEILLQKRSLTKRAAPGHYHISAAGHINVGETALEAAVRETREEVGIDIDPASLYFVHATRIAPNWQSLLFVYIYELTGDEEFVFEDGEVELVEWYTLETFRRMTHNAKSYTLVDQGRSYFDPLIATIERHAAL